MVCKPPNSIAFFRFQQKPLICRRSRPLLPGMASDPSLTHPSRWTVIVMLLLTSDHLFVLCAGSPTMPRLFAVLFAVCALAAAEAETKQIAAPTAAFPWVSCCPLPA